MRILVETHTMEIGGSQFNAVELADGVARLGHEVTVFGPDGPLVEEVRRRGLEWIQAPERRGTPCPATAMALTRLTRRRKFDVIHPYEWNTLLDTMYGPGWLLGTPVLSTVLSVDVPFFLPTSVPMIVCMRQLWEQERRRRPDVRFMEIPIDTELNAPGTAPALTLSDGRVTDVRSHVGAADDERLVVIIGRLASRLKLEGLLDAVAAMPLVNEHVKARLVIVGWCPDPGYAQQIRNAIACSPRAATMEWREGFVPNEAVAVWLRACDVVVMPYRNIYQSGVVFLCLRFGVPVVGTNVGSLAEFIDSDSGIITATNDPAGIADALDRFFSDPTRFRRDEIARRAAKYRWDRQCLAIKHLYF